VPDLLCELRENTLSKGQIMSTVMELKQQREKAFNVADGIITTVQRQKRNLTDAENRSIDSNMRAVRDLDEQIKKATQDNQQDLVQKAKAMLRDYRRSNVHSGERHTEPIVSGPFMREYQPAFYDYLRTRNVSASLQESVDAAGGFSTPITVSNQIVPLAPSDFAVRQLATCIPTKSDRLIPQKSSFGSAVLKTEASAFAGSVPSLSQIELSAFLCGTFAEASLEILQDVTEFENFVLDDISLDIQQQEEDWFVNGSGSGEPQGLVGNCGAGVTEEPDGLGNLVSISGTLDLVGSLKAAYYPNATWLMSRATGIGIRKAQVQTSVYEPVWTREGGRDYLHGFPVAFSDSIPAAARGAVPALFGDFKRGYLIGDRGGSAVRLKVVDQSSLAQQGIVGLIGYRRTDGRVRRSEAIQQYNIAAS
jgi:HK97 family phage major capsid protein